MNIHSRDVESLAAKMRLMNACPSCGGRATIDAFDDNDISRIESLPPALRRSGYVICATCALVYASWRQSLDAVPHYYALFPELEHREYASYPPPPGYRRAKAMHARRIARTCRDAGILEDGAAVLHIRSDCGSLGPAIREIADGCTVVGWDYFDSNIRWANETGAMPSYRLDPRGLTAPASGGKFDLIVANHVFTHSLEPQKDVAALLDMLKPGGSVFVYNENDSLQYFRLGYRYFKPRAVNNYHKQLFSPETLMRFFRRHGLTPLTVGRWQNTLSLVLRREATPAGRDADAMPAEIAEVKSLIGQWMAVRRSPLGRLFAVPGVRHVYKAFAKLPGECRVA